MMQELSQLKITSLRALANISTISDESQLAAVWRFVVEQDGPLVK
jgi:hypothetical protein